MTIWDQCFQLQASINVKHAMLERLHSTKICTVLRKEGHNKKTRKIDTVEATAKIKPPIVSGMLSTFKKYIYVQ